MFKLFVLSFVFLLTNLLSNSAQAKITIISITGASAVDAGATSPIVYGGTAGTCSGGTGTCNSCDGTLTACNEARITPTTNITIQFKSDAQTGYATVSDDTTSAGYIKDNTVLVNKDTGVATITFAWSDVCLKLDSTDCETNSSAAKVNGAVVFRVGIDSSTTPDDKMDNQNDDYVRIAFKVQRSMGDTVNLTTEGTSAAATNGITDWSVYPGDGKVYLEGVLTYAGYPVSANSIQYNKLHLYYRAGNCTNVALITNKPDSAAGNSRLTTGIKSDGQLEDDRFLGLTNDTTYVFKVALEDQAGNIGLFYPNDPCVNETHSVTPSEVFGLLKDQNNCFIATAAFGSPLEKHVKTLRQFRDQVLLQFDLGKQFVRTYYRISPPIAKTISESPILRALTQVVLFPIWTFASLTATIGMWPSIFLLLALTGALAILLSWKLNRRAR